MNHVRIESVGYWSCVLTNSTTTHSH